MLMEHGTPPHVIHAWPEPTRALAFVAFKMRNEQEQEG